MKTLIGNFIWLICMISMIIFLAILLYTVATVVEIIIGIIMIIGMIIVPIRIAIKDFIWNYKQYRKNRPVKILYWVKYKLER